MVSFRVLTVINVSLALVALVSLLIFLNVEMPTIGNALYTFDKEEAVCVVNYQDHYALLDVDRCCLEMQQQLIKGEKSDQTLTVNNDLVEVNKKYYTAESTANYFVNMKTYRYCRNNGFIV